MKRPHDEGSHLFTKGHPCMGVYMALILIVNLILSHSYSYSIYIFYYPKWISSYSKCLGYFVYELSWFTTFCPKTGRTSRF